MGISKALINLYIDSFNTVKDMIITEFIKFENNKYFCFWIRLMQTRKIICQRQAVSICKQTLYPNVILIIHNGQQIKIQSPT